MVRSQKQVAGGILWIGGVHGDEPEGVELAMRTRDWLCETREVKCSWAVIPCLNPDGLVLRQRMNFKGVDLNRNYPSQDWSPLAKAARYYPGPYPGSEPEIKALIKLIKDMQPGLIVHCHSWNPCIVYAGDPGRDSAEILAKVSGYTCQDDIGYLTPGSLSSYAWEDLEIPVICIEEQEHCKLAEVWPRFAEGVKKVFLTWTGGV